MGKYYNMKHKRCSFHSSNSPVYSYVAHELINLINIFKQNYSEYSLCIA